MCYPLNILTPLMGITMVNVSELLITSRQRCSGKVTFSVGGVCVSALRWGYPCDHHLDLFKLVQLTIPLPHHTRTPTMICWKLGRLYLAEMFSCIKSMLVRHGFIYLLQRHMLM